MQDSFKNRVQSLSSPAKHAAPIVPSDSAELQYLTRAVYLGASGDLNAVMASGEEVTFSGMVGGAIYPLRIRAVKSTGTTASDIIALW